MPDLESIAHVAEDLPFFPLDIHDFRGRRLALRGAAVFMLAFIGCLPLLNDQFLWVDEGRFVHAAALNQWPNIAIEWKQFHLLPHSPLLDTLFAAEQSAGPDAAPFHAAGIFLHSLNAIFVWLVLRRLQIRGAWFAAAVFALHPAQIQAVAWVGQQYRLWGTLFALAATLLYLRALDIPAIPENLVIQPEDDDAPPPFPWLRMTAYFVALLLLLAAVLTYPALAIIPAVWIVLVIWRHPHGHSHLLAAVLPLLAGVATAVVAVHHTGYLNLQANALNLLQSFSNGIKRLICPVPLLNLPPATSVHQIGALIAITFFIVAFYIAVKFRRRFGGLLIACLCMLLLIITILPPIITTESVAQIPSRDAEHYFLFIPFIAAIVAALVMLLDRAASAITNGLIRLFGGGLIVIALLVFCWNQSTAYSSTELLWTTAEKENPGNWSPRARLATWYVQQGNIDAAEKQISSFAAGEVNDPDVLMAIGQILEARDQTSQAMDCYRRALLNRPQDKSAIVHLAAASLKTGQVQQAVDLYDAAMRYFPDDAALQNDAGLLQAQLGHVAQATALFQKAIKLNPSLTTARINLANLFFAQGRIAESAEQLQEVIKFDPENFDAFHNAGVMLYQLKDYPDAQRLLLTAVQLRQDSPEARNDLGVTFCGLNKFDRAIYEFQQALLLRPGYGDAQRNLAIAQRQLAAEAGTTLPTTTP